MTGTGTMFFHMEQDGTWNTWGFEVSNFEALLDYLVSVKDKLWTGDNTFLNISLKKKNCKSQSE